jgi:thymidine kinase
MSLELYIGPMFAGKSSTILGIVHRNTVIGRSTLCITNALDTRYSEEGAITSHNLISHPALALSALMPVLKLPAFRDASSVIIEEAQFFPDLVPFVLAAVDEHRKDVVCVGLDGDSNRRPFGRILDLVPFADKVKKLTALCTQCRDGTAAIFTHRKEGAPQGQVAVGGQDKYEPMCRKHYLAAMAEGILAPPSP